jgi:hypothetical protein
MSQKYVTLDEMVKADLERRKTQTIDPAIGLFKNLPLVDWTCVLLERIPITEDIECEIIEPKQLPLKTSE